MRAVSQTGLVSGALVHRLVGYPRQTKGLDATFRSVAGASYGPLSLAAAGTRPTLSCGLYCLLEARYRDLTPGRGTWPRFPRVGVLASEPAASASTCHRGFDLSSTMVESARTALDLPDGMAYLAADALCINLNGQTTPVTSNHARKSPTLTEGTDRRDDQVDELEARRAGR